MLAEIEFDRKLEEVAEPCYTKTGRKSLPPGVYFRMIFVGYFEDISTKFQHGMGFAGVSDGLVFGFQPTGDGAL